MTTTQDTRAELSISYHNFWHGFRPEAFFFERALAGRFRTRIEPAGRDVQIYSVFGRPDFPSTPGSRPLRVWWTGECREPERAIFDLHFGFLPESLLGERWHRYPLWILYLDFNEGAKTPNAVERLLAPRNATPRERFCNFIYSNPKSLRAEFYLRLNARRPVDSIGRLLPTGEGPVTNKLEAISKYRATIAFENQLSPGYVTEKLLDPLLAGSVPIYWGADEAKRDFNPRAFIFARDFATMDDLINHIIKLDDAPDSLKEIMCQPVFHGNSVPYEHTPGFFVDRLADALGRHLTAPVSDLENDRLRNSAVTSGAVVPEPTHWQKLKRKLGEMVTGAPGK